MTEGIQRRDFLKGAGLVGAAMGAAVLGGCAPRAREASTSLSSTGGGAGGGVDPSTISWAHEADVIIVGSGSSGACAAIEAGRAGASCIIFEKSEVLFGGNSALCGGYILAGGFPGQEEMTGYAGDTPEAFAEQMLRWSQGYGDQDMIREACMKSPEAVQFMMDTGRVYKGASILPPIWSTGDTEDCVAPRSIYNHEAYGAEAGHMATLRTTIEGMDNVQVQMGMEVKHLIKNLEGEVIGVQLADDSYAKANKGVVLACASADNNTQMAHDLGLYQQIWGQTLSDAGYQNPGCPDADTNTGDGVRMLQEIGAALQNGQACCMNDSMYIGGISDWDMSTYAGRDINMYESTNLPGAILVDRTGHRFCQDDAEWGYIVSEAANAAWRCGFNPANPESGFIWYIYDSDNSIFFELKGHTPEDNPFKTTYRADTLEELAAIIGCKPEALTTEVERWNSYVDTGVDLDYGAKANLAKIATPPFYCDALIPGPMGTFAGAKTTIETEVLDLAGNVIPRLYAAGAIAGGMWTGPFYFGCGWAITNTIVWGRKAGVNAAALEPWA